MSDPTTPRPWVTRADMGAIMVTHAGMGPIWVMHADMGPIN